jgi:acetyl-CoA decarbonylase/synthase complex subunit gamma
MGLSGLEIYKHLPKTNCKDCGFPTCLAFALQLAAKKVSLDKCPHVSAEAKTALDASSQPPIRPVTVGTGDEKLELGNETVLFRHEETFYHPTGVGFLLEDTISAEETNKRLEQIDKLEFERVGQVIKVNTLALKNSSGDVDKFKNLVSVCIQNSKLNLVLMSEKPDNLVAAVEIAKARRPLLYAADSNNYEAFVKVAREYKLPLAVKADGLDKLSELTEKVKSGGVEDIILDSGDKPLKAKLFDLTQIRRQALRKNFRPLGYPVLTFTASDEPYAELTEAATYICKYASIVILKNVHPWEVLTLLTVRQNIYTDPQKPLQMKPDLYVVGKANEESPVLVTTNFSLTYYTVEAEVEGSRVPSYIVACDTEGMSVLTAWAAEKFTPESIAEALNKFNVKEKVKHNRLIIPGYVAVLSGKLEEASGREIVVGPREASGIPAFLKGLPK